VSDDEGQSREAGDFGDGPGNTIGRGADDVGGIGDAPGAVPEGEREVEASGGGGDVGSDLASVGGGDGGDEAA
jgi:hypothetical protein